MGDFKGMYDNVVYNYNITYENVTEESAEAGDFEDQGFEKEGASATGLEELVNDLQPYGFYTSNNYGRYPRELDFGSDGEQNYKTGETVSHTAFITRADKKPFSSVEYYYLLTHLGIRKGNINNLNSIFKQKEGTMAGKSNKKSKMVEKYEKRHYWKKIGEIIALPEDQREAEFQKWSNIFANDNPRFNARVFKNAYEKAIVDPSIVPNIKGGERAPLARRYDPDLPPVGSRKPKQAPISAPAPVENDLFSQKEVLEIVKHVVNFLEADETAGEETEEVEPGDPDENKWPGDADWAEDADKYGK